MEKISSTNELHFKSNLFWSLSLLKIVLLTVLDILKICKEKFENRIKIIKKKNIGIKVYENLNLEFLCKGKYIAEWIKDDVSLPERFSKTSRFLENNPEITLVELRLNLYKRKKMKSSEKK